MSTSPLRSSLVHHPSLHANGVLAVMALAICFVGVTARAEEKAGEKKEPEKKITYEEHILPLFREKCGSCHNANDKKGDLVLDNYSAAMQGGASGEVINTNGEPANSQLYLVMTHESEPVMPPGQPKLADAQLELVRKWIEQGALQNAGSKAKIKKKSVVTASAASSMKRPEGPAPMPEATLPLEPVVVTSRANAVTALTANPWSPLLAVSGHHQILLYNAQTLDLVGVLPYPEGQPHILKFSRNGSILLAGGGRGGQNGQVVLFDIKTGKRIAQIGGEYDAVLAADISPDQSLVALGGPKKMLRVYEVATGDLLYESKKHTDWITAIEFSPDGVLLASGDRSNGLVVWEAYTGREFYFLTGHTGAINDVSWSPDSNTLASGSEDGTIRLWEMQNGSQVKNFGAHGGGVQALDFTLDVRIVSTGRDRVTKLFDANGNKQRDFPATPDVGMEVCYSAETDRVYAGDLSGRLLAWNAKDGTSAGETLTNPASVTAQLATAQAEAEKSRQQLAAATGSWEGLKKQLSDRQATAEAAGKMVPVREAEFNDKVALKGAKEAEVAKLEQQLGGMKPQLESTKQELDRLTKELPASTERLATSKVALSKAQESLAALQKSLADAQQALATDAENVDKKKAISDLEEPLKNTQIEIAKLESAIQNEANQLAALEKKAGEVKSMLADQQKLFDQSMNSLNAMKQEVKDAEAARAAAEQSLKNAKAEAERLAKAAPATPEEQKQMAEREAAVKVSQDLVNRWQARVALVEAAKTLPPLPVTIAE